MTNSLGIEEAREEDATDWDAFVQESAEGTFFHRFGWREVIKRAYGHRACSLLARREGRIVGVLPLIDVASPLLGRNLISTAFTVGGGVLADDAEARTALAQAAAAEGRSRNVGYVELRSRRADIAGWRVKNNVYAGFEKVSPKDEEEALQAIPRKRRAEVRKALAALAEGALDYQFGERVDDFYPLYAYAMREHGTPVFPRRFAKELMRVFSNDVEILVITADGEPVLALLTFYFGDRVLPYYFAAGSRAREHRAFDLAIWLQMRRGVERGARWFDFGRSKYGSGSFAYKQHWGFEPAPLEYQYALVNARRTPNVNPQNPKFSAASAMWKHLPLSVANVAGPILARHLA